MKRKLICLLLVVVLAASCLAMLAACKTDPDKVYDKVTKKLKLTKDFEDKDFISDGIGRATLNRCTDGDTTNFRLASGKVIAVRYYQIDTPESTGGVEKWGKKASNFTKKILEAATEIVLEATATPAKKDAYGTRYLGYVWYRNSESESFKCLNLQIVENGFSKNTGTVNAADYPYNDYFTQAEEAASRNALHIWSNDEDSLYNDSPIDITIKQFYATIMDEANEENGGYNEELYNAAENSGAKIRFEAYLSDLTVSGNGDGTYTFVATQYDPDEDKYYSLNLYCMYVTYPQAKLRLGELYTIIGSIQRHGEGSREDWQISGLTYNEMGLTMKDGTTVKQSGYYLFFDSGVKWYSGKNAALNVYDKVTVGDVTKTDTEITFKGTAKKRTGDTTYAEQATEFTFTVPADHPDASKIVKGKTLTLHGFQFEANSGNITVPVSQSIG